jgi:serine/threonine protein phosphatase PrpC
VSHALSLSRPARMAHRLHVEAVGRTHIGLVRDVNEDRFAVLPHLGLFMLADGMGGVACGDVASTLVIDHVRAVFDDPDTTWPKGLAKPTPDSGVPLLVGAIQRANCLIRNAVLMEDWRRGMGTTFVGILVLGDRVAIAHVGDSRAYRLRGRRLDPLTEDHSLANEYIRAGLLNRTDVPTFPYRNILSRAVDGSEHVEVETRLDAAIPGDVFVLCSDGLHGMVGDAEITGVLLEEPDLGCAADRLIRRANANGGDDNITIVLARIGEPAR